MDGLSGGGALNLGTLRAFLGLDTRGLDKGHAEAKRKLASLEKSVSGSMKRMLPMAGQITAVLGVTAASIVSAAVAAAGAATLAIIKTGSELEQYEIKLKTVLKDGEQAKSLLRWIEQSDVGVAFKTPDIVEASIIMEKFGFITENTIDTIGDAAYTLEKDIKSVASSVTQGMAGNISGLRQLGITEADIVSKIGHKINTKTIQGQREVGKAILEIMRDSYGGSVKEFSKSLSGTWSLIKNWVVRVKSEVSAGGIFDTVKKDLREFYDFLDRFAESGGINAIALAFNNTFDLIHRHFFKPMMDDLMGIGTEANTMAIKMNIAMVSSIATAERWRQAIKLGTIDTGKAVGGIAMDLFRMSTMRLPESNWFSEWWESVVNAKTSVADLYREVESLKRMLTATQGVIPELYGEFPEEAGGALVLFAKDVEKWQKSGMLDILKPKAAGTGREGTYAGTGTTAIAGDNTALRKSLSVQVKLYDQMLSQNGVARDELISIWNKYRAARKAQLDLTLNDFKGNAVMTKDITDQYEREMWEKWRGLFKAPIDDSAYRSRLDKETSFYESLLSNANLSSKAMIDVWEKYRAKRKEQIRLELKDMVGYSGEFKNMYEQLAKHDLAMKQRELFEGQGDWLRNWAKSLSIDMRQIFADVFFAAFKKDWEGLRIWLQDMFFRKISEMLADMATEIGESILQYLKILKTNKAPALSFGGIGASLLGGFVGGLSGGASTGSGSLYGSIAGGLDITKKYNRHAAGAIVMRPEIAQIGEVPEAVIPLSKLSDPNFINSIGGAGGGDVIINQHINTPDVKSFKASQSQIMTQAAVAAQRARRNM